MGNYCLSINGENTKVEQVPEDMPLLWVLRDIVGLRGTKFGWPDREKQVTIKLFLISNFLTYERSDLICKTI